jgi:hypothetical protein
MIKQKPPFLLKWEKNEFNQSWFFEQIGELGTKSLRLWNIIHGAFNAD